MAELLIGLSGYDHPELKGSFYPVSLARKDFLSFYASQFNACEINSTFYGMPTAQRLLSFYERSEGRLKFSVKLNRLLTHDIDSSWKVHALEFRTAVMSLLEKNALASVLFQFPERFHYSVDNRFYLKNLIDQFFGIPCVVEFRHKDWIRQSVFDGLSALNCGIVFCDMPRLKNLPDGMSLSTPFISDKAYIRFHGRNENAWYSYGKSSKDTERYDYDYSTDELKSFIPVVSQALAENKNVQLYFNNHPKGTGVKNALEFKTLLKSSNIF